MESAYWSIDEYEKITSDLFQKHLIHEQFIFLAINLENSGDDVSYCIRLNSSIQKYVKYIKECKISEECYIVATNKHNDKRSYINKNFIFFKDDFRTISHERIFDYITLKEYLFKRPDIKSKLQELHEKYIIFEDRELK